MRMDELMDRYGLSSRQTIYNWAEAAEITFEKGDYQRIEATPEQVEILDSVKEHLRKGNSLRSFVPPSKVSVVHPTVDSEVANTIDTKTNTVQPKIDTIDIVHFLSELALRSQESQELLEPEHYLQELADNGWLIESSRLEKILGVRPRLERGKNYFTRRGWKFTKAGRNGREAAWKVEKC